MYIFYAYICNIIISNKMEKIKKLRLEVGMSQAELAKMVNMRRSNFNAVENGKLIPNNKEKIKEQAVDVLYPLLMKKILAVREDLERLESMSLMFRSK